MEVDPERPWPLAFFSDQIQSPSLESLTVRFASEWEKDPISDACFHRPLEIHSSCSALTTLISHECSFIMPAMTSLLRACRDLRVFWYCAGGPGIGPDNFRGFELQELLEMHKSTLRQIRLNLTDRWLYDTDEANQMSFADFSALEDLDVTSELNIYETPMRQRIQPRRLCNCLPSSLRK